jgi:hypothetical protein
MTKKILLVFANYNDERQNFFNTHMSPRNEQYANNHGFEYLELKENLYRYRDSYTWLKFTVLEQMLEEDYIKDGDVVTHLDADMCVVKTEIPYETSKSFSYSIDSGNTHCMGSFSIKVNEWTRKLVSDIISVERYNTLNDAVSRHERFGYVNSFWHEFREQASWYSLAGIKRHSDESFWNLPNNGWHSDKNEWTVYSLEELNENVELLPTAWNVTEMEGESSCEFLINKVNKKDVIIRHFAGGQEWRKEWFDR